MLMDNVALHELDKGIGFTLPSGPYVKIDEGKAKSLTGEHKGRIEVIHPPYLHVGILPTLVPTDPKGVTDNMLATVGTTTFKCTVEAPSNIRIHEPVAPEVLFAFRRSPWILVARKLRRLLESEIIADYDEGGYRVTGFLLRNRLA